MLPIVAFWSAINVIVLFLVCMMSLQAPMRRGEERFELDEPIWVFGPGRPITRAQLRDISLSGVGIEQDASTAPYDVGDAVSVYVAEVGFIAGNVVRQGEQKLAVQFDLPPSVERDLLIRKLLTAGNDTKHVAISALAASRAMLDQHLEHAHGDAAGERRRARRRAGGACRKTAGAELARRSSAADGGARRARRQPPRARGLKLHAQQRISPPTMPRRNSSTQTTKITPWTTITHWPIWAR